MLHRALYGSLERFVGIFIEHTGGEFPVWVAPVQATIVPVHAKALEYARSTARHPGGRDPRRGGRARREVGREDPRRRTGEGALPGGRRPARRRSGHGCTAAQGSGRPGGHAARRVHRPRAAGSPRSDPLRTRAGAAGRLPPRARWNVSSRRSGRSGCLRHRCSWRSSWPWRRCRPRTRSRTRCRCGRPSRIGATASSAGRRGRPARSW